MPVPTEFSIKKSKRKEFKKGRKDYIKNMHRAHPDDNWEQMDANTRLERINKTKQRRLLNSSNDRSKSFARYKIKFF